MTAEEMKTIDSVSEQQKMQLIYINDLDSDINQSK